MRTNLPNSLVFLLKTALTLLCGAPAVFFLRQMLQKGSALEVICSGVFLLISLYIFGIICAVLYSGGAAQNLTDFLFFPKRYLKKAPPVLSRQQGLIADSRFEEAETELLLLRQNYKSSPEIAQMLITLHADCLQDTPAAIADCRFFFANRKRRRHELNLFLLFRYADFLCAAGEEAEAWQILAREQNTSLYAPDERKAIKERLDSLSPEGRKK